MALEEQILCSRATSLATPAAGAGLEKIQMPAEHSPHTGLYKCSGSIQVNFKRKILLDKLLSQHYQ